MRWIIILLLALCLQRSGYTQATISFTFDDGITNDMPGYLFEQWNGMLLKHLKNNGVKAIFFVTGFNKLDAKGRSLLESWNDQGHSIGNHTYAHPNYNSKTTSFEQFTLEFLKNDSIISQYSNYLKMFRFPYLKEGDTKEKVDRFRSILKDHNYRNGYVTIDASDWYVDGRLRARLRQNLNADIDGFRKFYLEHLYQRAQYYEDLAFKLTGRHIKHTALLHHNLTSALFLGDLIKMFRDKGWNVVDAPEAYGDEIFKKVPANIPAGESLIWALAKESGKFDALLRYPAEDGEYEKAAMDKLGL